MRITPNSLKCPKSPQIPLLILLVGIPAPAQQPFTQTAPIYSVNAQYVQGVGIGYWPTAGSGLVLNLASGTSFCNNAASLYPGGSLTMTANATNYVYIDPVSCVPAFNTTGYPASAAPLASVLTGASSITSVNDQRTWFVATTAAASMANAASFSGGSVGAQIDNACASFSGKSGVVEIPAAMGAGQSLAGLPEGCAVLDLRGAGSAVTGREAPDQFGDENQITAKFLFRDRILPPQPSVPNTLTTGYFYSEPWTGGVNTSTSKANYFTLLAQMVKRTPGQSGTLGMSAACMAAGDCEPVQVTAYSFGDENAGGDEGAVTFRGNIFEGTLQFQATVSSVSGGTLSYSSSSNENTRGEGRWLIDTTKADTRGSVTSISGSPAVVTATGTLFATNHGGTGSKTSLCFELAGSAGAYNGGTNPYHDVYPVASVQSDTQLTLNLNFEGTQQAWFGDVSAGAPTLYPCSTVSSLGLSGSINVADGTQFSSGDTILETLGHQAAGGINLVGQWYLPMAFGAAFASFHNEANRPWWGGLQFVGNFSNNLISFYPHSGSGSAPPSTGLVFVAGDWNFPTDMIDVQDTGTNTLVRLIGVNRNSGGDAYFSYSKQDDAWNFNGVAEINAATGNATFNNLPPVYNAAGTAQTGSKLHMVEDQVTLSSGAATVTLSGSAAFSSSTSYKCAASDQTGSNAVKIAYTSGSQFAVAGTGSDLVSFVCVGN